MSTSLYVFPLRAPDGDEESLWRLLNCSDRRHGVPDRLPEPQPLPTVEAVMDAWAAAGLHGEDPDRIPGLELGRGPQLCPDRAACAAEDGRCDLGEWDVQTEDKQQLPDSLVDFCSFRRPNVLAVLAAAEALARIAGPHVVYDPVDGGVCVVDAGDQPAALAEQWWRT